MAESFNIYCLIISKTNIYISQMVWYHIRKKF
jgi:hypothetical protein